MIKIHVFHNNSYVRGQDAPISQLRKELSFHRPTNLYILKAKMPDKPLWLLKRIAQKGQTINLLHLRDQSFPSGLLKKTLDFLESLGKDYCIIDHRKYNRRKVWECTRTMRDYQELPVDVAVEKRTGILNIATRGGKTVIAQAITARTGLPTMFIVKSKELLKQTIRSFRQAFPDREIGQIGDGVFDPQEITVCIIQSLLKNKEEFKPLFQYFKLIFFDEVHNFGGMEFFNTARKFKAPYRYGLSGTAFRNDDAGMLLNALCGDIISKIRTKELVEKGVVYRTKILMHHQNYRLPIPITSRDWRKIYNYCIVNNMQRNKTIRKWARRLHRKHYTVLILVKEIEHVNILRRMIERKIPGGVRFMNGQETAQNREDTLKNFCLGHIPVLIGTKIYNEGVDFVGIKNPDIKGKSVIFAGAGKSKIESIQMAARPTTKENKEDMAEDALIIDFIDSFHGLLQKHSMERMKTYRQIGEFDVSTVSEIPQI